MHVKPCYPITYQRVYVCLLLLILGSWQKAAYALNPANQITQYGHTAWRMQDGVFASKPNSVAQTRDGYLWLGTADGLLRFDGLRFTPWAPPDGAKLPDSRIWALLASRDGSLWIGTWTGLLHLVNGKLNQISAFKGTVESLIEDESGTIWIARAHLSPADSRGGLCSVNGGSVRCYGPKDGISTPMAEQAVEDKAGNIWLAGDTLTKWHAGSSRNYDVVRNNAMLRDTEGSGPQAIAAAQDGTLWVGMLNAGPGRGLQHLVGETFMPVVLPGFDSSTLKVASLFTDSHGSLWVGTMDQGLYRIRDNKVSHFAAVDGLSSDAVYNFAEDAEGTLWVITSEGVDQFKNLEVATFSLREGLSAAKASTVVAARDGAIWIGNYFAIDVLRGNTVTSLGLKQGFPGTMVMSMLEDSTGRMWVGVDGKLFLVEHDKFREVRFASGASIGVIGNMAQDDHGDLWVTTDKTHTGKLIHIQGTTVSEQPLPAEGPGAYSVASDPAGGVWLGLRNGDLGHLKDGSYTSFTEAHRGVYNPMRAVGTTAAGYVLGIQSGGLLVFRDGVSAQMTVQNGLPCGLINSYITDLHGDLYVNAQCGILVISAEEFARWWRAPGSPIAFRVIGPLDGARTERSALSPASARSPDGRLWFVNERVLQVLNPADVGMRQAPPPVVIETITENGKVFQPTSTERFAPHLRTLLIDYTALSFASPQRVNFRYRLENHDSGWQEAGTRRQALYNDLSPGTYRFRVTACNGDGVWNETGATLAFFVAPAFYQTFWFRSLMALLFGVLLYAAYLLRLRTVTTKLEGRLLERFSERERIARELHDTLLQGFQSVIWNFQSGLNGMPKDDSVRTGLERAIDRAEGVLMAGRDRVRALRSKSAERTTLETEVRALVEEIRQDGFLNINVTTDGTQRLLNEVVQEEVFAIFKEALKNSVVHAKASQILCEIVYEKTKLVVSCRDDGRGLPADIFKRNGVDGHFGLLGMKERAAQIEGNLEFKINDPEGTLVQLSVKGRVAYRAPSV